MKTYTNPFTTKFGIYYPGEKMKIPMTSNDNGITWTRVNFCGKYHTYQEFQVFDDMGHYKYEIRSKY